MIDLYGKLICQRELLENEGYKNLKMYDPELILCLIIDYLDNNEQFILHHNTVKYNIYATLNEIRFIKNNKIYIDIINKLTTELNEFYHRPFDINEIKQDVFNKRLLQLINENQTLDSIIKDAKNDLYYFDLFIRRNELMYNDFNFISSMSSIVENFSNDDFEISDLIELIKVLCDNINRPNSFNRKEYKKFKKANLVLIKNISNIIIRKTKEISKEKMYEK